MTLAEFDLLRDGRPAERTGGDLSLAVPAAADVAARQENYVALKKENQRGQYRFDFIHAHRYAYTYEQ